MDKKLLTIREAAKILGVSVDTLRRWDKNGKLPALTRRGRPALRKGGGTHRYYVQEDIEVFSSDLLELASHWALNGGNVPSDFYCQNSAVFQTRLLRMQGALLSSKKPGGLTPLIVAITGEIGNNSYDHNLGNWRDVPGVFFGYDVNKGVIVLADRGQGVLKTLMRVRPSLADHEAALRAAFTETISGRSPEKRGNGLKFVRKVISENPIDLFFQSGDAKLRIKSNDSALLIEKSENFIPGCLARIKF